MELKIELIRFIKNNIKRFLKISALIFLLILGVLLAFEFLFNNTDNEKDTNDLGEEVYTSQFDFYVENQDGSLFSNPAIIKENIILSELPQKIEKNTNADLIIENEIPEDGDIDEAELEEEIYLFDLLRDSNSGRYTFVVFQDNLANSNASIEEFYSVFENQELDILENKNIFMFNEPYLLEDEEKEVSNSQFRYLSFKYIIVGLLLSLFMGIALTILKDVLSKTINYYFSYDADKQEQFVLIDKELNNKQYLETLTSLDQKQLFLSDKSITRDKAIDSIVLHDDLANFKDVNRFDEIIIFVFPFETTKLWYKKQKELLSWYNKPVKIIQVND